MYLQRSWQTQLKNIYFFLILKPEIFNILLQTGRWRVQFPVKSLDFSVDLILPVALWHWAWLSLKQTLGMRGGWHLRLTALLPSVSRLYTEHPTTLWASTACYRDSFTFFGMYMSLETLKMADFYLDMWCEVNILLYMMILVSWLRNETYSGNNDFFKTCIVYSPYPRCFLCNIHIRFSDCHNP
jgi:hypothetical protein